VPKISGNWIYLNIFCFDWDDFCEDGHATGTTYGKTFRERGFDFAPHYAQDVL